MIVLCIFLFFWPRSQSFFSCFHVWLAFFFQLFLFIIPLNILLHISHQLLWHPITSILFMLFQVAPLSFFLISAFISFCCEISQPSNTFSCRTHFLQTFFFSSSFITSFLLFLCPFFFSRFFLDITKMACPMFITSHPLHPSLILSTFNHKTDINFMSSSEITLGDLQTLKLVDVNVQNKHFLSRYSPVIILIHFWVPKMVY